MYINSVTKDRYVSQLEIRFAIPSVSLVPELTLEMLENVGVFPLVGVEPEYDPITQALVEIEAEEVSGVWTRKWEIVTLPEEQVLINKANKLIEDEKIRDRKIEALWAAADKYVTGYISGVAFSILAIGVMQAKPKALAVAAWSNAIWTEYYVRKAMVTTSSNDNHDFSSFGAIPHSIPELQAEIGI